MTRQKRRLASSLLRVELVETTFINSAEHAGRKEMHRLEAEIEKLRTENARLSSLAYRDALTGLRNRRCFGERLSEELCRLRRNHSEALAVICIDVNGFKGLNDTRGHAAGDAALVAVGRVLESLVRSEDLVCRTGGDEFAVLLPDTDRDQAERVMARIRSQMSALTALGLSRRALALGVASWLEGDDEARLLTRADAEMYTDKRRAREDVAYASVA